MCVVLCSWSEWPPPTRWCCEGWTSSMLDSDGNFVRSPLRFTGIELSACQVRHLADEIGGCEFFDFAQTQLLKTNNLSTQKCSQSRIGSHPPFAVRVFRLASPGALCESYESNESYRYFLWLRSAVQHQSRVTRCVASGRVKPAT